MQGVNLSDWPEDQSYDIYKLLNTNKSMPVPLLEDFNIIDEPTETVVQQIVAKKIKKWPENRNSLPAYEDIISPIKKILDQGYSFKRKVEPKTFDYDGYDYGELEAQFFSPIKERLSESGLAVEKEKNKNNLIDILFHIVFLLGMEQGRRTEKKAAKPTSQLIKALEIHRRNNLVLRSKIDQLEITAEELEKDPNIEKPKLKSLIKDKCKERSKIRISEFRKELEIDPSKSSFVYSENYKASFKDLTNIVKSLEKNNCSMKQWIYYLQDNGWTFEEWSAKCKKKNFVSIFS